MQEQRCWSPKTWINRLQEFRTFFNFCVRRKYLKKNPAAGIEKPKLPKRTRRYIEEDDLKKILSAIRWIKWRHRLEAIRNEAIFATFTFSGLRRQELIDLEVRDVQISDRQIHVRQGKNNKDRYVVIPHELVSILNSYVKIVKAMEIESQHFFFGVFSKRKMCAKQIERLFKVIRQKCGVYVTPHMLRHSYARLLLNRGVSMYTLKELLGHESIVTTEIYSSIAQEPIKQQIDQIRLF